MPVYEKSKYITLLRDGPFEIREYDAFYSASALDKRPLDAYEFNRIFDYINGNNNSNKKISMTIPVINQLKTNEETTEFILPSKFSEDNQPPQPRDDLIRIRKRDKKTTAALGFRGVVTEKIIKEKEKTLLEWVNKNGYIINGDYMLARYNPPFVPSILRKNEILIDVIKEK